MTATDRRIIEALRHDGRESFTDLAKAVGTSTSTVARRVDSLRASGTLFFDIEMDDVALGITAKTMLWISAAPAHVRDAAKAMSRHPELAFVAATTGRSNLVAQVLSTDLAALHRYLTSDLALVEGITDIESAPILTTFKANGTIRRRTRG